LRDLDEVVSYVFREGRLHLALPIDSGILTFEAQIPAEPEGTPVAG
jgi:hypothetical protein